MVREVEGMGMREFDVTGRIWFRESTDEWVMSICGVINDTSFESRHTAPKNVAPEDVACLGSLYDEIDALKAERDNLRVALKDCCVALESFVDLGKKTREPYRTPLSAYDRAMGLLQS